MTATMEVFTPYPPDADKRTALSSRLSPNQTSGTKLDSFPPVIERVCQHLIEGDLWLPAGRRPEPARVGDQDLDVGGPHLLRCLPDLDRGLGHRQHAVQDLPNARGVAGADVVDLPRLPFLEGQPVRPDHVPDIGEVPERFEVAHLDDGFPEALLDLGDLLGEIRRQQHLTPARPSVVERTRADGVQTV